MESITTVGVDLAKTIFQVHAADAAGSMIFTKSVRRAGFLASLGKLPPCLVGMEACVTAHHWVREVEKLGHTCNGAQS